MKMVENALTCGLLLYGQYRDYVKVLIAAGADLNVKSENGNTALMLAALNVVIKRL